LDSLLARSAIVGYKQRNFPFYANVIGNYVGYAPECLLSLNELELSFILPVKGYRYCLSWVGGAQKCLKGHLTFMRVKEGSIVYAAAQLEEMGLKNHIVVLLNGKMTRSQKDQATKSIIGSRKNLTQ
jgi:hypothetical protein